MTVCLYCVVVGAVSVIESPGSCREGAGSIPAACMALLPKGRERLTEQVAERTAARGGGVFFPVSRGAGIDFKKGGEAHLPRPAVPVAYTHTRARARARTHARCEPQKQERRHKKSGCPPVGMKSTARPCPPTPTCPSADEHCATSEPGLESVQSLAVHSVTCLFTATKSRL